MHTGDRPDLAAADRQRCAAIVATPQAVVLAAMVNAILQHDGCGGERGDDADACLVTVGGGHDSDPIGLIRCWPETTGWGDYLLTHAAAGHDDLVELSEQRPSLVERYSLLPGAEWWAGDVKAAAGHYRFRAYHGGVFRAEIRLGVPGSHQVLPALAALAIGLRLEVPAGEVKDRLEDFSGVPRGFESRGSYRGATLLDDQASGVGAVGDALRLAREVVQARTIWAVYLPHPARRPGEQPTAADFAEANHLILVEGPFPFAESTRLLAASLRSSGASVVCCASLDEAIRELDRCLEPGDVLVTLGAGEVGTIADAFLRRLSSHRHG